MTNKEAIKMQEAIKAGLKETGKDHPYRDALIPPMKESCNMAIEALEIEQRILDNGYTGKEAEFRIGGRLFGIREKAQ